MHMAPVDTGSFGIAVQIGRSRALAMRLGFVGCGTITSSMVTGLCSTADVGPIIVSPRNAKVAAGLASRFANVQIAPTNQAVLDACERNGVTPENARAYVGEMLNADRRPHTGA
jgi:hypothetical protein